MKLRYLCRADIERLDISMVEVMEVVEEALRRKAAGETNMTTKTFVSLPRAKGGLMSMGAYVPGIEAAAIKWLGYSSANRERGLPLHTGLVILNDPETTLPISVMDAAWVTSMRTGAASGVAMKYLGPERAEVVAVLGCGVEGRSNLAAMHTVYPAIKELRCYDISPQALDAFVQEGRETYRFQISPVSDPQQAVSDADVVVTAGSSSATPYLKADWLKAGAMAAAVDLWGAWESELACQVDKLVTDDYEKFRSYRPKGQLKDLPEAHAELGEIITGRKPGREHPQERAMSMLGGVAVEDAVTARLAYNRAVARDVGSMLPL